MKRAAIWFLAAGVLTSVRAAIELADPAYFRPVSVLDYTAVVVSSVAWGATAVALYFWWRHSPIRRGSTLALVAALGLAASSVGNLLEDAFSVDSGEWLFTYGGMTGAIAILALAVVVLSAPHPLRWSGIFLFAFVAGSTFPDDGGQWLSGLSLLVMGWWLWQRRQQSAD